MGVECRAEESAAVRYRPPPLFRLAGANDCSPEFSAAIVMYKHRFSGFYQTDLDLELGKAGINHLIVTGCTTSICVESTIRDAFFRDYRCVLPTDCTSEPIARDAPGSNHDATLFLTELMFRWVSTSRLFLSATVDLEA